MKDLRYEKPLSQEQAEARDLRKLKRSLYFHIPGVALFVGGLEALTGNGLFRDLLGDRNVAWMVLGAGVALLAVSVPYTLKLGKRYAETVHKSNPSSDDLV